MVRVAMLLAQAVGSQDASCTLRRCGQQGYGAGVPMATAKQKKSDAVLDWCGGPAPEIVRKVTDPELCEAPTGVEKGSATEREGGMPAKKLIKFAAPKPLVEAAVG